nr:Copper resistance protein A [Chlamydiota bacterium]
MMKLKYFACFLITFFFASYFVHVNWFSLQTIITPKNSEVPRPWAAAAKENLPPGEPGKDFTPAVVPNGVKAEYQIIDGVKVFHLIAEIIEWEVANGLIIHTWGYNGTVPGPLIEVAEGDKVRIYVTNKLPASTTVHWHGVLLPCGMDGVSGLTQPAIPPGETFRYEFFFPDSGTFMYHPHHDTMTQEGMGLNGMILVHKR